MEMVDEKGLSEESADMIGEYVKLNGKFCFVRMDIVFCHLRWPTQKISNYMNFLI